MGKEINDEKVELVRVTEIIARGILARGGNVDLRGLEQADKRLDEAIDKLRSVTYAGIHDFSFLIHLAELSRGLKSGIELLTTSTEIVANLRTGRLTESVRRSNQPRRERQASRY